MQDLLNRAVWERDRVRDGLQADLLEMPGPGGMLVIDETGVLKKGDQSVGVQRQDSGTAGRIENGQLGVFLTYALQGDHTLVDRELDLPKSWTTDRERCRAAHVPDTVGFATKPELAARMLWRALDAGLAASWVTGDTVSGSHRPLRQGLEERGQASAMAVPCSERVSVQGTRRRVDAIANGWEAEQWQPITVGNGSKGPRAFEWACGELDASASDGPGWQKWLLVRRSLVSGATPAERASVRVFAPAGTTLAQMAITIGARWSVEQCCEEGKGEVGWDHYDVRSWQGWDRHITLSMLAHAFLLVVRTLCQTALPACPDGEENNQWIPSSSHSTSLRAFKLQRGLLGP